jgi:thioredoxin 1
MADVTTLTNDNFQSEVKESDVPVLVDFYADWCGPCKMMAPVVEEIAGERDGKVKIAKVDCDQSGELAGQFGVSSIPTMVLFKGGEEVDRRVGASSKEDLLAWLDEKAG